MPDEASCDVVFLGFNYCAERVLDGLRATGRVSEERPLTVVTEEGLPASEDLRPVRGDFASPGVLARVDWTGVDSAVVFSEGRRAVDRRWADMRVVIAILQIPDEVRVVAEIVNERHADVLRETRGRDLDLVYKERYDANLVGSSILHAGRTTGVLQDISDREAVHLEAFRLPDLTDEPTLEAGQLRRLLHDRPGPTTLLGIDRPSDPGPTLLPPQELEITAEDVIYCLVPREDPSEASSDGR